MSFQNFSEMSETDFDKTDLPRGVLPKDGKFITTIFDTELVMCKPIIMPIKSKQVIEAEKLRVQGNKELKRLATAAKNLEKF